MAIASELYWTSVAMKRIDDKQIYGVLLENRTST